MNTARATVGREWRCHAHGCDNHGTQITAGPLRKWCSDKCRKTKYDLKCVDCGGRVCGTDPGKMYDRENPVCGNCAGRHYAKWDRERIVAAIQAWAARYGRQPGAVDWNPPHARTMGQYERAERFYADGCWPHLNSVQHYFGSWNEAMAAAGFRPARPGRKGVPSEVLAETARLYTQGLSGRDIAERLGITTTTVYHRLKLAGVERRPRPAGFAKIPQHTRMRAVRMYADGASSVSVADQLNTTPRSVIRWARQAGVPIRASGRHRRMAVAA